MLRPRICIVLLVGIASFAWRTIAQEHDALLKQQDIRSFRHFLYEMGPAPSQDAIRRAVQRAKDPGADGETLFWAAECPLYGWDKSVDFASLIERAVDIKYPPAMALLGSALCTGVGIKADAARGLELLRKAGEMDDPLALYFLSNAYAMGFGGAKRDLDGAVSLAQRAADKGMLRSLGVLAKIYNLKGDHKNAAAFVLKAADAGDVEMMMGLFQANLKEPNLNQEQAQFWLRRGAFFGNHAMMCLYALAMEEGRYGLKKDSVLSRTLLERAANEGDKQALANLAYGQVVGAFGMKPDPKLGLESLRKLADDGLPSAQYYVGHLLFTGKAGEKNEAQGIALLEKAAAAGDGDAKKALAEIKKRKAEGDHNGNATEPKP